MDMENMVSALSDRVPTDNDTHMGDDGLLYCNRCHTARQSRFELFGKVRTVNCLCQCMAEERDRQEETAGVDDKGYEQPICWLS